MAFFTFSCILFFPLSSIVGTAAQVHVLSAGGTESAQAADGGEHPGPAQTSRQAGPATDQVRPGFPLPR